MSYLVKALAVATLPKRQGQIAKIDNWSLNEIDWVDDEVIQLYQDKTDVFTIIGERNQALTTGVAALTGLSATTIGDVAQQVTFTLANVAQAITNTAQYAGTKLYDFPAGRILVLGVTATLAQKTTSALESTLNASSAGVLSLGTTTAASTTLDGTQADLLPSTAFTSSATINVAGTAVSGALAASAQFDGTSTAKSLYLNSAYVADGLMDADATQSFTGTITVTFVNLGDY